MYTVGRLGSYITRSVYTVSGPFHPFGGAVDIIVVEQPDGSFKSSPWYVRFGKFQGVLRAREKVVNINVNGVDVDLHMYLDERGQAYFLREIEGEDEESVSSSSGDETDEQYQESGTMKSKSCNYDSSKFSSDDQIDRSSGKIVAGSNSQQSKIFGLVFGQRSLKKDDCQEEAEGSVSSLERTEVAASLLDENCSADFKTSSPRKIGGSNFSASVTSNCKEDKDKLTNDGQNQMDSSAKDVSETSVDQCLLADETGSNSLEMNGFLSGSENQELFMEQTNVEISSSVITERTVHTFKMDESAPEETPETSVISRSVDEHNLKHICEHADDEGAVYDGTFPDDNSDDEWVSNERNNGLTGFSISGEGGPNKIRSFLYCEKTESSVLGLDEPKDQSKETLHLTSGGSEEVHFCSEALHVPTELLHEDRVTQVAENIELKSLNFDSFNHSPEQHDPSSLPTCDHNDQNFEISLTVPESHTEMATMDPILSIVDVGSNGMSSISDSSNSKLQIQNEINTGDDINSNDFPSSIKSNGGLELFNGDGELTKTVALQISESAEEQFLFSDIDETECAETNDKSNFPVSNKEDCASSCLVGSNEVNWPADTNDDCDSPGEINMGSLKVASSPIFIPKPNRTVNAEVRRLGESLPNILLCTNSLSPKDIKHPLSNSLGSNSKSLDWNLHSEDEPHFINSDMEKENQSPLKNSNKDNSDHSKDVTNAAVNPAVENQSGGSWKFWPFSFRRSRSRKATQPTLVKSRSSDAVNVSDGNIVADDDKTVNLKASKKMVRANTPTSEELASLNLKDGSNVVTFTFSTAMLGKQKVDARIYLWHWNTRIVISDVDGTITRSDVLGQFMPLVGVDWSQTGVAHLFSAIKENGYQLLFLSARAISQAYITRQFLVNLKQDGKALPDGPVVISPDGLFPSLFREVIRRAPHEFKIACLEDIKALFPPDCNPFYAGFGNRDTDEISYFKVGIPKGKIFIINPRGEVAVNRRVDTKSYSSLHDHVHGIFPVMTSSEQEDYNSWNFWRLPPPDIDL